MTVTLETTETAPIPGFVEKTALERYVAPAKPSLVGLSRVAMCAARRISPR
jgi:hypothetical protein